MGKLQDWAASDREQAEVIRWLVAVGDPGARASLSGAQADGLDATADGWETIASATGVDDPDQH